jgi:hypothetical protein
MKTIVTIPLRKPVSTERLREIMVAAGSSHLVVSLPVEYETPEIEGGTVIRSIHENCPDEIVNGERVRWLANKILVPMVEAVQTIDAPGDVVLRLDDSVHAQQAIPDIIDTLRMTPKIAFASCAAKLMSWPGVEPKVWDYTGRCNAWRIGYYVKFVGAGISPSIPVVTETTLGMVMKELEKAKQEYFWTTIPVQESNPYTP